MCITNQLRGEIRWGCEIAVRTRLQPADAAQIAQLDFSGAFAAWSKLCVGLTLPNLD
jgi:hypothetical protein